MNKVLLPRGQTMLPTARISFDHFEGAGVDWDLSDYIVVTESENIWNTRDMHRFLSLSRPMDRATFLIATRKSLGSCRALNWSAFAQKRRMFIDITLRAAQDEQVTLKCGHKYDRPRDVVILTGEFFDSTSRSFEEVLQTEYRQELVWVRRKGSTHIASHRECQPLVSALC